MKLTILTMAIEVAATIKHKTPSTMSRNIHSPGKDLVEEPILITDTRRRIRSSGAKMEDKLAPKGTLERSVLYWFIARAIGDASTQVA